MESRAVRGFQLDDGVRGVHRAPVLPASGARILPVFQYDALCTALGHARDPRARPAHEHHVSVRLIRNSRVGFGPGTAAAEEAVRPTVVLVVLAVHAGVVGGHAQRHAVDAILGRGERQPLAFAGRVRRDVLSEHDQPPVVQHRHVVVEEAGLPVVRAAREPPVVVERPVARLERLRLIRCPQKVQVVRYPPAEQTIGLGSVLLSKRPLNTFTTSL